MNLQHDRIANLCSMLKLERIASEWPALAQRAAQQEASLGDFLEQVLVEENNARLERQRSALLKMATLPSIKTLEQYDFGFASGAPPRVRIVVAPIEPETLGAAMKDESGSIRTSIQGQGGGADAAAGERAGGGSGAGGRREREHAAAVAQRVAVAVAGQEGVDGCGAV